MATTLTTEHPHTGDGSTTNFLFSFPYLKEADVKVTLDHVATTAYTFANASTISFTTAPASGVAIRIFRDTDVDAARFVFSSGSSLKSAELNENLDQLLYADQERASTDNIADQAVTTAKLRDGAVTADKLGASAIITAKIADSSVTTAKIANSSVTTEKIADSSIVSSKYANESVGSAALAASGVTEAKLASNSVTTDKILDNSVTLAKLNSGALPTDITITSANIVDGTIATVDIADDAVTNAQIATNAVNADSVQNGTLSSAKLTAATVVTNTEQAASTPNNTSFFTTSASDGRYFRQDSTETITSGVTWTSDDARVATTAAIDARIVDLVEEVGGFVPIANETSFPAANPDVNNGAGTIVSVSAIGTSRTPSSGSVTIADGAGTGNTVTITGVGSQELTSGFGMLLETTSTLHTYTFHRLTPPATNVNTVATNIADVNTVAGNNANVTTVANINSDVTTVATNNTNVTTVGTDIANVNTAAGSIANINTVASDLNEATSEIDTVATNIADVNAVGTDITNVNTVATNINSVNSFADVYRIAASDPTTSLDIGDLVFNTTNNALRVYNGTSWQDGVTAGGNFMSKTGDAMSGNLNMQNNKVENLANATANGDAVSKSFMDAAIDTALTTDVIGGQSITVTDNSPGSGQISVSVTGGSIGPTQLASTAVTAGTYGASQNGVPSFTVDADGRITAASNDTSPTFSGNVGIGTTSQTSYANSQKTLVIEDSSSPAIAWSDTGQTRDWFAVAQGSGLFFNYADGGGSGSASNVTNALTLDNSGNIGVGTSSPSNTLSLEGSGTGLSINSTNDEVKKIEFKNSGTTVGYFGSSATSPARFISSSAAELMRIDASGRLLVGTTTEGYATFGDNLTIADSGHCGVSIRSGTSSQGNIYFSDGSSGGSEEYEGIIQYLHDVDAMAFGVNNGTERLRIDSSGNVGIGTTSTTSISNYTTVTLNGTTGGNIEFKDDNTLKGSLYNTATDFILQAQGSSTPLAFRTNSNERMRIDSSGNVGIGKSSDLFYRLTFQEGSGDASRIGWVSTSGNRKASIDCGNTDALVFRTGVSDTERMRIDSSGNVVATGDVTAFSDIRLKKDIELIPNALDKVLSLRGVTYTDIELGNRRTGVIAQEVQAVLPEAVKEGDEYLSVAYGNLVGVLIESIKELEARVRELEGD